MVLGTYKVPLGTTGPSGIEIMITKFLNTKVCVNVMFVLLVIAAERKTAKESWMTFAMDIAWTLDKHITVNIQPV